MEEITLQEAMERAAAHADQLIERLKKTNSSFTEFPEPLITPEEKRAAFIQNHLKFLARHYLITR